MGSPELLSKSLIKLYKNTWLSLQRNAEDVSEFEEFEDIDDPRSDVDKRLSKVFTELIGYFSRLDRKVSDQTNEFQKQWFLSFLTVDRNFSINLLNKLDVDQERLALQKIFDRFGMTEESYDKQLTLHIKNVLNLQMSKSPNSLSDILLSADALRLHSLVEKWQQLQTVQREIYAPKLNFIKIATDMLYKKSIDVNSSNSTFVKSERGDAIPLNALSSGEKQLLISLSETLMQEGSPHIFVADEPELSLHIEWQEELVPSLLAINPNAQVIFATHSPDIVGKYQKSVFRMEEWSK